ncbi:hypothetical protein AVEN_11105-1 [Araneus ventricosus]|uniref:Uncharacterized protein n=1 Tax=Araneus ventricosus TaxID=182803 RepID=A0A4Y2UCK5_ARAVE|nr:hypothetical protein AVEN_11105-1 [Araneus ventricosus]
MLPTAESEPLTLMPEFGRSLPTQCQQDLPPRFGSGASPRDARRTTGRRPPHAKRRQGLLQTIFGRCRLRFGGVGEGRQVGEERGNRRPIITFQGPRSPKYTNVENNCTINGLLQVRI